MRRDPVDALAAKLFAAAREERPDRELAGRVERASAASGDGRVLAATRGRSRGVVGQRRARLVRGLLAAIACAGVAGLVWLPRVHDAVIISAERSSSASSPQPPAPDGAESAALDALASRAAPDRDAPEGPEGVPPSPRAASTSAASTARAGTEPQPRANTPSPSRAARARPAATEAAAARQPAPPGTGATLSNELGALKEIRRALRDGDGAAALALLDRYDTGEQGKRLAPEASVLRMDALDALGRRADAEALARRFVRDNPDSPLAERAQRFLDDVAPARPATGAPPDSVQP